MPETVVVAGKQGGNAQPLFQDKLHELLCRERGHETVELQHNHAVNASLGEQDTLFFKRCQ